MSHPSQRRLIQLAGWSVLAATAALVGCGKKEEAAPAVDTTTAAPAPAMTDSAMPMDSMMTRDSAHSM